MRNVPTTGSLIIPFSGNVSELASNSNNEWQSVSINLKYFTYSLSLWLKSCMVLVPSTHHSENKTRTTQKACQVRVYNYFKGDRKLFFRIQGLLRFPRYKPRYRDA